MPIGNALNTLVNSGQNIQQPDMLGKYFAGMQIQQNNQNQEFQNNLLQQRADIQQRTFDQQDQQYQQSQLRIAERDTAFDHWANKLEQSGDPKLSEVAQNLRMYYAGDPEGAMKTGWDVLYKGTGDKYLKTVTDDSGRVTGVFQSPQGKIVYEDMGVIGQTKSNPNQTWYGMNPSTGQFVGGTGQMPPQSAWNPQSAQPANQPAQQTPPPQNNALATDANAQMILGGQPINPANVPFAPKGETGAAVIVDGQGVSQRSLPGSQHALNITKTQQEIDANDVKAAKLAAGQVSQDRQTNDTATAMIVLIEDIKSTLNPWALGNKGALGKASNFFGTSSMEELESKLRPIKSNLSIEAMKLMRKGSASGATGMGAMSQKEQEMIESLIGSLDPLFPKQFWTDLNHIQYRFERLGQMAEGIDPGAFDPSVYMNAASMEDYQANQVQKEAQKALDKARPNQLSNSQPIGDGVNPQQINGTSGETLTATNPKTGERVISNDGGMTWRVRK